MKKFLKIMAVILLSLLIFFVGLLKYRQYKANQTLIPKNTNALIKINVDEIYKTLSANIIANPKYYFKNKLKKDSLVKKDEFDFGLKIPASIYFYTFSEKPSTTLFSRLDIDNLREFESFLRNTLHLQIDKKTNGLKFAKSRLGNFAVCYNNQSAAIVLATQIQNYEPDLIDVLNQKGFIKIDESDFEEIVDKTEHLAFINQKNTGIVDFKSGKIDFNNQFTSDDINLKLANKHRKINDNATVSLWLNADFKSLPNRIYRYKNFSLGRDSLLKYYNGKLDFEWTNSIQKTDSVITYEYNDDFEKVEKVSLQKRNILLFSLNLGTKVDGLKNYLAKQGFINLDSSLVNKNAFPLYKVFVSSKADYLNFSTEKNNKVITESVSDEDFFYLNIDFMKLSQQLALPILTGYLKSAKSLEVRGKVNKLNKVTINGSLELKNEDINSLYQILVGL